MYIDSEWVQDIKEDYGISISQGWYTKAQLLEKSSNTGWKDHWNYMFETNPGTYSVSGNTLTYNGVAFIKQ
jgi:hypothetical protein